MPETAPEPSEHTVCSSCRIDGTCVNDTPAPERPEVEADELAAAERWIRGLIAEHGEYAQYVDWGDQPPPPRRWAIVIREYDRRGEALRFLDEKYNIRREQQQWQEKTATKLRERIAELEAAAECIDPVYREHTRFDLERELRECRSDHRDLYLDLERRTSERDQARADLARALPVVEAAGALESWWSDMRECYSSTEENDQLVALLDALAREVRAAREPQTEDRE